MSVKCPFTGDGGVRSLLGRTNRDWWPQTLNLEFLSQGGTSPDPMGDDFDYCEAFNALDYNALKADLTALMTASQDWWPADYGHSGPLFIRMARPAEGTSRTDDGARQRVVVGKGVSGSGGVGVRRTIHKKK